MLDAPMPYLCGISRENFPYVLEDISNETVVVVLDRNVLTLRPNTPDLLNRRKKLEGMLKANAGDLFWEANLICHPTYLFPPLEAIDHFRATRILLK